MVKVEAEALALFLVAFLCTDLHVSLECLGCVFLRILVPLASAAAHVVLLDPA